MSVGRTHQGGARASEGDFRPSAVRRLTRPVLAAVLLVLACAFTPVRPSAQERSKRGEFGSSLERLRLDAPKKAGDENGGAVGKGAVAVEVDEDEVVRVESTLVTTDVLVVDKAGRAIRGLTQNDFVVTEEGEPQPISTFAVGDDARRPRSIVLIIDYSGSQRPYLGKSIDAAKVLVEQLRPADSMAVVTDDVSLLLDFTQDKAELKKALESLREKDGPDGRLGASRQYSALMASLRELVVGRERPIVIFQTDGDELPSLRPLPPDAPPGLHAGATGFGLTDVITNAERAHVTVYNVVPGLRLFGLKPDVQIEQAKSTLKDQLKATLVGAPGVSRGPRRMKDGVPADWFNLYVERLLKAQTALEGLAKLTGGWTEYLEEPGQAHQIYARILSDINNRYVLGFQPTNKARDGRRHKVSIEVRGRPEYVVWGRKSYYAPGR